jgi:hypothetical protein
MTCLDCVLSFAMVCLQYVMRVTGIDSKGNSVTFDCGVESDLEIKDWNEKLALARKSADQQ